MYNIKLDENKFYTGSYAKVGKVQGGMDLPSLPPTEDSQKALCYKYDYHDVTSSQFIEVPVTNEETGEPILDENSNPIYTTEEEVVTTSVLGWYLDEDKYNSVLATQLQELKNIKKQEMNEICQQTIWEGVDVALDDTTPKVYSHFSFTLEDQSNIKGLYDKINKDNLTHAPYHADGELCRLFTAKEIIKVYNAMEAYKTYNITLCNFIKKYIDIIITKEEFDAVVYNANILPEEYLVLFNELLSSISS